MTTGDDEGATLVELLVVMVLIGVLASIATTGFVTTQQGLAVRGTQRELLSGLREAQSRAVQENRPYCVDFAASGTRTWTSHRLRTSDLSPAMPAGFACTSGPLVATSTAQGGTSVTTAAFTQRNGATTRYVVFYPRGAASPGSVAVVGAGGRSYSLSVDGLTSRVESSGR